jgi:hypothetical protein
VVKPGNYATDINIHNPGYRPTPLRKKFLVLVENGQPSPLSRNRPSRAGSSQ